MRGRNFFAVVLLVSMMNVVSGCGPSFSRDSIEESIVDLCKREYDIDVKVATIGQTIAIYLPLKNLLDLNFTVTKESSEKINDVLLSATRVAISTDAVFNYYCVIAHDARIPEIQIVVIKSVDDVKRFLLSDISRGDYSKRMLIDLRMNPQAKKEKVIKGIFKRMQLDKEWQEELLNDFFRTEPGSLNEIGYWNGKFFIKDIVTSEFIAEQINARIKIDFKEDAVLSKQFLLKSSSGAYITTKKERYFKQEIYAAARSFEKLNEDNSSLFLERALRIAAYVIHAYRFEDFDHVELISQKERKSLVVTRDQLERFRRKKITFADLMKQENNTAEALYR